MTVIRPIKGVTVSILSLCPRRRASHFPQNKWDTRLRGCDGIKEKGNRFILFAIFCVLFLFPVSAHAASGTEITLGGRHAVYWAPDAAQGKQPLILFSHGFKGCSTQSTFLTEALATDGYWVFAPNHDDAHCGSGSGTLLSRPEHAFGRPEEWNEATYTDRADDMRDVIDALQHAPQFKDRIDFTRIGLVGHSLGGYTVLGLGGAWPGWKLPGVKAVLALSPYSEPFNVKQTLKNLTIPVMYQGGTRDTGITPHLKNEGGSYDQTPAPKYFVEFDRAGHLAWTNLNRQYQASIIAYSEAFFDHYVKGLPATPALTKIRGDVSEMKYDSELGQSASATGH